MKINNVKTLGFAMTSVMINAMVINLSVNTLVQANTQTVVIDETQPIALSTSPIPQPSVIDAKSTLMTKLAGLHYFSANFSQEVFSDSGELLEKSSGKLAISKPNLAYWHTLLPDELSIVSDGNDVWFYNPWIEQVSAYSLSAAIAKTPILLLTSKDKALWDEYNVYQKTLSKDATANEIVTEDKHTDSYVISAKDTNSQIKSLTLVFDNKEGQLSQFSFLDATGQLSHITLNDFNAQDAPKANLFNFVVPEGVQLDDQRAN